MFSLRALVWSLLQAVFVATFDVAEQRVLTLQDPGLVLRRFIAGPSDGIWNVHAIHAAAQVRIGSCQVFWYSISCRLTLHRLVALISGKLALHISTSVFLPQMSLLMP